MYIPESMVTCFIDSKPTESLFPQEPGLTGGPISPPAPLGCPPARPMSNFHLFLLGGQCFS